MEEEIRNLFAAVLQIDPVDVQNESTRTSIKNWTSLNHLALIAAFEEEFEIEIEPEEIFEMITSFGRFKEIIVRKLS